MTPRRSRWWETAIRLAAAGTLDPYVHAAYRIRGWGRLPQPRDATLVVANHQHDLDSMAIMSRLILQGPWPEPIRTVSSRRMFEPGFFAVRTPWVAPLVRRYDPSALFAALGPMPIENDLRWRTLRSVCATVRRLHGNLPLADVIAQPVREAIGFPDDVRVDDLGRPPWFDLASAPVDLHGLREPYRADLLRETRRLLDEDLARIEDALRSGGTFFVTPEGHYSTDGRMLRFRAVFARLAPLADIWLAAISYDPLRGRRLSQLYRIVRPAFADDIVASLKAARPVTVSHLFATWLLARGDESFTEADAVTGIAAALAALPPTAFIDPELRASPPRTVVESIETSLRLGVLERGAARLRLAERRRHPRFADVADIVAFQAAALEETLEALRRP